MSAGSSITTSGDNVSLHGGTTATTAAIGDAAGTPVGVQLSNATITTAGGNIDLRGTGRTNSAMIISTNNTTGQSQPTMMS
jgi:hypothetical protein